MLIDIVIREGDWLTAPYLQRLLAFSQYQVSTESLDARICHLLGIKQQADWPVAAISSVAEFGEPSVENAQNQPYWLMVHPVHLVLQRDYFSLYPPALTQISVAESLAFMALLNQHFNTDGLQFFASPSSEQTASAWYLKLPANPGITTVLPDMAIGRDIRQYMPVGENMAKWHGILNEVQMLLHDHPLNQVREANGLVPINSVWLSGGGVVSLPSQKTSKAIFAQSTLLRGLAAMQGLALRPIPENVSELLAAKADILLEIKDAEDARHIDFKRILKALRCGQLSRVNLYIAYQGQLLEAKATTLATYKLWRKSKSVEQYFKVQGQSW